MTNGVLRHHVGRVVGPEAAFFALAANDQTATWWESLGERGHNRSYLGFGEPLELISGTEWDTLSSRWTEAKTLSPDMPDSPPLGLVGWLAYDLSADTLGVDVGQPTAGEPSRSHLVDITRAVEWDFSTGEAWLWAVGPSWTGELLAWRDDTAHTLLTASEPPPVALPEPGVLNHLATWRDTPEHYRELIRQAREHIRDGEVYQLCLTTNVTVDTEVVDQELYRLLRHHNPAPHQALFRRAGVSMVASSPETFLQISPGGLVTTKPIKGTRKRGDSPESDVALAEELASSDKEQAENLMIVDLMRNDLSRVCDEASISVPQLLEVESYPSVHQLVSTVTGQLKPNVDALDAVKACFPGGSMTGAPKHRAVSLLSQMESGPRGAYSGCFGVFSVDGSVSLAMTIRTVFVSPGQVSLGVGGGITWSSVVDDEVAEVGHKARAVLSCLGVSSIQYS
jgi:para-aminobenzoate synthetase component 1